MRVTVFFASNNPIGQDVQSLLTEYQYAAKGKIDIENVDPDRNYSRAKALVDKYKIVSDESQVILDYDNRNKTVKASEMAEVDQGNPMFGEPPKMTASTGEQAIAIVGPQYDFSDREMKLLRDFWEKQGRILLLLDPSAKTPKLLAFLNELGVKVNDDRLMALMKTGIQEMARVRDVIGRFLPESPITKKLVDVRGIFVGGTSSLTLEPDRVRAANVKLQPLIQAEKGYWAEKDYNSTDEAKLQADAAANPDTPLIIGASIEKGGSADERVQTNSARMVVVTNASFIQDSSITQDQQALDYMSGSINWLLSREQLIGIAPKVPQTVTFSLDDKAMSNLRWLILVLLPLIPAVLGFGVWWYRRA